MAISSPALVMSIEALFGAIKPATDTLQKLGAIDFSKEVPGIEIKPGTTMKVPLSTVTAASAFTSQQAVSAAGSGTVNNYLTGGTTGWGSLTATHYLQGFDVSGVDIDSGVNAARIKNIFAKRAGMGIALACMGAVKSALDGCTASSGATLTATNANSGAGATVADYLNLAGTLNWLDKTTSVLAVNGATLADIKSKFAAINVTPASLTELAQYLGYRDMVLIPGMTARAVIVPAGTFGSIARVPAVFADYKETGTETDEDSGLSIGIVVANDQGDNRQVVNADLWFGCIASSASANNTTTHGILKFS